MPTRIAKGELEGKMKCRIWRKLHAEEAQRFSQAYELMEKIPGIELADAFGIIQSGRTPEQFLARKARTHQKQAIYLARSKVDATAVNRLFQNYIANRTELSIVLASQTVIDIVTTDEPVALSLERHDRLEKLNVVLLTRRSVWERVSSSVPRETRLAKKPLPVAREPERRPVADPRPFLPLIGATVELHLRNGIQITDRVLGVGPFDVLLGKENEEILVPLHAIVSWRTDQDRGGAHDGSSTGT